MDIINLYHCRQHIVCIAYIRAKGIHDDRLVPKSLAHLMTQSFFHDRLLWQHLTDLLACVPSETANQCTYTHMTTPSLMLR